MCSEQTDTIYACESTLYAVKNDIYRIYIEPHKCVHLNVSLMMKADPTSPPILVQLFTPQEGHSFTNSHIVVVEVAKAGKCDSRECEETCPSHLDFKVSMNVVSHNLAKTPRKHKHRACFKILRSLKVVIITMISLSIC